MRRRIKMNDSKKTCCKEEKVEEKDSFLKFSKEGEISADEKINNLLKALKNDNREICFSLLNYFCLNKDIEFQNLKESFVENVEGGADANEYINVNLLEKEIYPQDGGYEEEKNRRQKLYNMILHIKQSLNNANEKYRKMDTYIDMASKKEEKKRDLRKENYENDKIDENEFNNNIPHYWEKNDVVMTFNPVYNARIKLMNDEIMNAIPTVDIFYNSSKLLSIQTIFEPVSRYIFLLRLLPHFCLPLYDSGILQFVCEDAYLNPKFKGLEISYRLLIHDILFYAFFSYLADLPFWAKPPIQLLRIYNYESLYSLNDWDSVHTERLVFHNIKNILFNFSDTLSKIELLYPKDYYITVFPNIYFKNVIDFLRSEHFKLKKIVIVVKGKKYIDENMMKVFRENLREFKGMTTENVKKTNGLKNVPFKTSTPHVKVRSTKNIIEEMKNCLMLDKKDARQNAKNDILITNSESNKAKVLNNRKNENFSKSDVDSVSENESCSTDDDKTNKKYNTFSKWKESDNMSHKRESNYMEDKCTNELYAHKTKGIFEESETNQKDLIEGSTCNREEMKLNSRNVNTNYKTWKEKVDSLNKVDLSNKYNMDNALYDMYYERTQEKKEDDEEEDNLFFNTRQSENTKEAEKMRHLDETGEEYNKKTSVSSSGSTYSEDESDDENVDGFFKSKKLKTTVYDKRSFSLTQMMSNVIHFERIIEYLYSDDHHVYDPNAKVKFYVKLLAFEKTYTHIDEELNSSGVSENRRDATVENAAEVVTREEEEAAEAEAGRNSRDRTDGSGENINFHENNMSEENGNRENTETTNDANVGNRRNIIFNNFIPSEASTSISNLIRNFQLSLEQNNFLPFTGVGIEEEIPENSETHQNSLSFDNIQDSLTRITFNFN